MKQSPPFWKSKTLDDMSEAEWESLCDGCGLCCLNKLEDWDTGEIFWTNVACELFDANTCRCTDYQNRFKKVPDCLDLTPALVRTVTWLPETCAYKVLDRGEDLPDWHPLVTGRPETVHEAGISVKDETVSEADMQPEDYEDHVISGPEFFRP